MHEHLIKQILFETNGAAEKVALLVSGSPRRVSAVLVSDLAALSNFVLAADSGAEILATAHITPDLLLGDFDSIDKAILEALVSQGVETETHDAYKDATDTELALEALHQRGYSSIIATNVLGGRIDHELATLGCFAAAATTGTKVLIAEDDEVCVFLDASSPSGGPGTLSSLSLDFAAAAPSYISLVPWGGSAEVSIRGVEWELDHATLNTSSSLGISNEPRGSQVSITAHTGTVMVIFQR